MPERSNIFLRVDKPLLQVLAFTLVLAIGWIQLRTGSESGFSFLYLLPMIILTWRVGLRAGVWISLLSALSWLLADLYATGHFRNPHTPLPPLVCLLFRAAIFLSIVFMIARHKKILAAEKEMAMLDPLTGVANRRGFQLLAQTEINRSRRYNHPFSVMFIDIDDFKKINDHFGHLTGDRLLLAVVQTIRNNVRAIDIVARFGGDEFVVLLVRSEEKSASLVAGKLHQQLLSIMKTNHWNVTLSIGLATYHTAPDTLAEIIKEADELMYQVKRSGKNDIRHAVIEPGAQPYEV